MFDLLGGHGKVTQILEPRKAFAGSKPTSNFLPCGSRLPLTTKRRPTTALLSKLRRPLNVIHSNDRFTKFNRARGNSVFDPKQVVREALAELPVGPCDEFDRHHWSRGSSPVDHPLHFNMIHI